MCYIIYSHVINTDHIERIANLAGKDKVGFGSDYDGINSTPEGLEVIFQGLHS
jgi:microsomal dipeptidase-like Zn-dependent dipeptidase